MATWKCRAKRDWPLGPDQAWDSAAADRRVSAKCDLGGDSPNWALYAKCNMFTDMDNAEAKDGHKGLFCDVVNGDIMAMPRVFGRAWGRMMQADVPQAMMDAANRVRDGYMGMMDDEGKGFEPQVGVVETAVKALAGSAGDNSIDMWVSREEADRENEVLVAAGAMLDNYLRNPVVLWAHDTHLPPIAKAPNTFAVAGEGVLATWEFADTPFGQEVGGLYLGGFLSAASHGFRPMEMGARTTANGPMMIARWELLEQSAVAVPCNALALAKAYTQGSDLAAKWLAQTYPDLWGANASGDRAEQAERVRLTEEERIAADLQRVKGGAESLRNIARHQRKAGDVTFDRAPVEAALANLVEVLGPSADISFTTADGGQHSLIVGKAAAVAEPHPQPAATDPSHPGYMGQAEPQQQEPNPDAGAPSEADLSEEVLAGVQTALAQAQEVISTVPAAVAEAVRQELDQRAKSYIGRRVPPGE